MRLAYWIKKEKPAVALESSFVYWLQTKSKKHNSVWLKSLAILLISSGLALAGSALWPMMSYKLILEQQITQTSNTLIPLKAMVNQNSQNNLALNTEVNAIEIEKKSDFNLINWFPQGMPVLPEKNYQTMSYSLSIPRLEIKDVKVTIDGRDLSKSLIQYKGTSVPGDLGQPVVFGHSNLPQFYSPTNYKTIFTKLPQLKIGDKIVIKYDGVKYEYQVVNLKIVKPDNFTILEQYYNYRGLRLVTCVPPGTTWDRLVVESKLIN